MTVTSTLQARQVGPTFAGEVTGIDFSKPFPPGLREEVEALMYQYGVLIFRGIPGMCNEKHLEFSSLFGDLDSNPLAFGAATRLGNDNLFDISNLAADGKTILKPTDRRFKFGKGNALWHVDASFNQHRDKYSILAAYVVPPNGGDTHFADLRTAYDDLPEAKKKQLEPLVLHHSLWHSRKLGNLSHEGLQLIIADPAYVASADELKTKPGSFHTLIQDHPSGRKTMYVSSHAEYVVGEPKDEGLALIAELIRHATQPKYFWALKWQGPGDMVMWDNRSVMHKATEFAGSDKVVRDMRRTSVLDDNTDAYGVPEPITT